jgi:hypothetical protein
LDAAAISRSQFEFAEAWARYPTGFPYPVGNQNKFIELSGLRISSIWADFDQCGEKALKNRLKKGAFGQRNHEPF